MKMQNGFFCQFVSRVLGEATLLALVVLLPITAAQAQHEADNWIFGNNAGLTFSSTGPGPFNGTPQMTTQEGSSSISDQNGNLLFYTDGTKVWNKNHQLMPYSVNSNLHGGGSSTQSALIVPWPDSECQRYFIFTVDQMGTSSTVPKNQKLYYAVVDMQATTGSGLGDVTSNTFLKDWVSEKLAAVKDSSGTGFWVVAHGFHQPDATNPNPPENKEFYAYHITSATTATNLFSANPPPPVISTAGTAHQTGSYQPSSGQMKISPDGKLIACAVNTGFVELLNFDSNTGAVTGPPRTFDLSNSPLQDIGSPPPSLSPYGLEFSPLSQFLYVSTLRPTSQLLQLDLTTPYNSGRWTQLSTGATSGYDIGQLQLGPDKKIYVARNGGNKVSIISSPDTVGTACSFSTNGPTVSSGSGVCQLGLPTMIGGNFSCAPTATPDPCCPPWNATAMPDMLIPVFSGGANAPYTLHFVPTAAFNSQMQTYINYLYSMNPLITQITIDWRLHDQGTGTSCTNCAPPYGTQIGQTVWTYWTQGGSGSPTFTNPGFFTGFPMVKGHCYMIHTGIYLEGGQHFFPDTCSIAEVCVQWQVSLRSSEPPVLEIRAGKKVIKRIPITKAKTR